MLSPYVHYPIRISGKKHHNQLETHHLPFAGQPNFRRCTIATAPIAHYRFAADAISRMTFQAAHSEYMWFAKSTLQDDKLLVDEEELYNQDNTMLMRRAFGELTIGEAPTETIPVEQSMLAQHPELEVLQKLQKAFQRVQDYQPTDANQETLLQQMKEVPHGTLILLDGCQLSAPLDLSALTTRKDVQVLATDCTGLPTMTITKNGKMISCNIE